jgi:hypothetical protein
MERKVTTLRAPMSSATATSTLADPTLPIRNIVLDLARLTTDGRDSIAAIPIRC